MSELSGMLTFNLGSTLVTGTGTRFTTEATPGTRLRPAGPGDGLTYQVAVVESDTRLYLSAPYNGPTASGVTAIRL